jgi:hypothetical protein
LDRPRWRTTISHRFTPTLQAGLEFNAAVGEVDPIANWFALKETTQSPAVIFGTSSDRIGTPKGKQALYVTVSKQFERLRLAPYFSVNYSQTDRGLNLPFGATYFIDDHWSVLPMYDGHAMHSLLTYANGPQSVQIIAAWNRRFGIAFGYHF